VHGDDDVVGPAEPADHAGREAGLHLQCDARIRVGETLEDRRQNESPVIIHHAETNASFGPMLPDPLHGFVAEHQDPARIPHQPFAGTAQRYIAGRALEQFGAELRLQPFDLRTDRRLRPIERGRGARKREQIGDGEERLQELRIQPRVYS
jgi:hypothetical protein